jgi:hypothetical protein
MQFEQQKHTQKTPRMMKSGDQQKDENVNKKTTKMAIGNNNELKKKKRFKYQRVPMSIISWL